jgi:hypothetical protein
VSNYWVLNASKFNIPSLVREVPKNNLLVELKINSPKLLIKEGDNYIILKQYYPTYSMPSFSQFGVVNKITPPVLNELTPAQKEENAKKEREGKTPIHRQEYISTLTLEEEGALKVITGLDDFTYSLLSIYRYTNPKAHFRRQYTAIYEPDYETITKEQVYIARTAFGRLINALPQESKYDFILHAINHFGTVEFKGIDFIKAYEYLQEYIEENILSQGRYLVSSYEMLSSLRETEVPIEQIGFAEHESKNTQSGHNISIQARYFQELFNTMKEQDFSGFALQKIIKNDEEESRFEEIFKNRPWPVDITI